MLLNKSRAPWTPSLKEACGQGCMQIHPDWLSQNKTLREDGQNAEKEEMPCQVCAWSAKAAPGYTLYICQPGGMQLVNTFTATLKVHHHHYSSLGLTLKEKVTTTTLALKKQYAKPKQPASFTFKTKLL